MDNINQTIPMRKRSTDSSRNHQPDSQASLFNPSFAMNPIRTQHQLQQRQRQRQHSPHEQVYNFSPNARASTQHFSNYHNYHPNPTRIPSYNSTAVGASTSTNQPISSYSNYYPSGIPFVRAGSVDEDLLAQGRGIVDEETRQAIDDDDRRKEQSRQRGRKYRANQKE